MHKTPTTNPITRAQQLRFPGFAEAFEAARNLPSKKLLVRIQEHDSPDLHLDVEAAIDAAKERRAARFDG